MQHSILTEAQRYERRFASAREAYARDLAATRDALDAIAYDVGVQGALYESLVAQLAGLRPDNPTALALLRELEVVVSRQETARRTTQKARDRVRDRVGRRASTFTPDEEDYWRRMAREAYEQRRRLA